jgi:hypothetical protein
MKWFKFYGQDWISDPKIASMRMEDKLCLIALFTIASSEEKDGYIPSLTEEQLITIARIPDWITSDYNPMEKVKGVMGRYEALHIVTLDCNGGVTVCNFSKRQGENLTNAERQKRYRIKLKLDKKQRNNSNASVTTPVTIEKIREDKNNNADKKSASPEFPLKAESESKETPAPPTAHQQTTELFDYFSEQYLEKVGDQKPIFAWGRCEKTVKPFLKQIGLERMKKMVDAYFKEKNKFYVEVAYSLEFFLKAETLNKLNQKICR